MLLKVISALAVTTMLSGCGGGGVLKDDDGNFTVKPVLKGAKIVADAGCALRVLYPIGGPAVDALCERGSQALDLGIKFLPAPNPALERKIIAYCAETHELGKDTPEWQASCKEIWTEHTDALLRAVALQQEFAEAKFPNAPKHSSRSSRVAPLRPAGT